MPVDKAPEGRDGYKAALQEMADRFRANGHVEIADRIEERECGGCTFCCKAKGIDDLDPPKPSWEICQHACEAGCSIYEERPRSCQVYACAWRMGIGRDSARPDKIGVMIDAEVLEDGESVLTIRATGPYDPWPVIRAIRDGRKLGAHHVGFTTMEEDRSIIDCKYFSDPGDIERGIGRHAGRGETGWNRPSKEKKK